MIHDEHDLRDLLIERSGGGSGGAAHLEEIIAKGRRIRRRRRVAAVVAALAVVATPAPLLLHGGRGTASNIAATVEAPREEGIRLAGARFETEGKTETLSFVPRTDRSSYRVNCAGPVQTFVRFGNRVDRSDCGSDRGRQRTALGTLEGAGEGTAAEIQAFTVRTSQVPPEIMRKTTLTPEDFDRVLAGAAPGPGFWEIAVHDGGVSTRSCSPDICLDNGTMPATKGERNLGGLPDSHTVESRSYTKINKRFRVKAATSGPGSVYVRCEDADMYAFIWPGVRDGGVLAVARPCGPKPAKWDFLSSDGVTVAVVPRDRVPSGTDFMSDLQKSAETAEGILDGLAPAPGNWDVAVQQWDVPAPQADRSSGPGEEGATFTSEH
ncbi:hypothetical protein ACFYSC_17905 [Streptosporangium sp. NPDC004379]|uniref:hypothetical protein n=1 Tax=Streptosporangium sp. NPDC004379 TaxID=3366189 RepID=UPI0036A69329